jgi:hypothetical protein
MAAATDLLQDTEREILETVSAKGTDATAAEVIRAVSMNRPPAVVREAYWQLISENRLARAANGHLDRV